MTDVVTNAIPAPDFKDRRGGLIFFGVLEILLGAVSALIVPLTLLSLFLSAKRNPDEAATVFATMTSSVAVYGLGAAFFLSIGIGSLRCRRWSRAIMTAVSWIWLVVGIQGMIVWLLMMPGFFEQMAALPTPPGPRAIRIITTIVAVFLAFIYILLPAAFALFYTSRHVKATCEHYDPQPRWTDRCPLPVLALVLLTGYTAFTMVMMTAYRVVPFFGMLLTGVPALVVLALLTGVFAAIARLLYRLSLAGWWSMAVVVTLGALSYIVTFARIDVMDLYRAMGFTAEQMTAVAMYNFFQGPALGVWSAAATGVFLLYLVYVKKFFKAAAPG